MKRTAILFLVLALLLTACAHTSTPETSDAAITTTQAPAPTEPASEAPAETDKRDPDDTLEDLEQDPDTGEDLDWEEPETTEPTEPEPTLPQEPIDWQVYTDWSQYRPYGGAEAKYTRLREGPLDHFEPSEDYGAVYPYIAAQFDFVYEGNDADPNIGKAVYGFVDRNGRILTDGLYRDVTPLDLYGEPAGDRAYWKVARMIGLREHSKEYMDLTGEQHPDYRYGLIAMDGSFVLDCVYKEIYDTGNGILCRGEGDAADFTVYDSEWKPMFTGAAVTGGQKYDSITLEYGEGLYLVTGYTVTLDEEIGLYRYSTTCWFCDKNGKQVLGPYQAASSFHEGLACVSTGEERYGYVDQAGNVIIEPAFEQCEDFENGRVLQYTPDGDILVLDRSGKTLFSLKGSYGWEDDFGYYSCTDFDSDDVRYFYDRDGKLLYEGTELRRLDEKVFVRVKADGTVEIVTPEGMLLRVETELVGYEWYPRRVYLEHGAFLKDGALLLGWYGGQACDGTGRVFIPSDFSQVLTRPDPPLPSAYFTEPFLSVRDEITGELWYFCWTGTGWEGRTESGSRCTVPVWAVQLQPLGDMVLARTRDANCLVKLDGEIVFRFPIDTGD